MAGLLTRLLGGPGTSADADPVPGIGGYGTPRGPAGQTGAPGTTAWTRENPPAAAEKRPHAPGRTVSTPPWGRNVSRPRYQTITQQQAATIPAPAQNGSLPFQGQHAAVNPDEVRHTEQRPRTVISRGIPGGQRQRNTVYQGGLKAVPGAPHAYRSAPKGDHVPVTTSVLPSRYVFGGVNGGTDALDDMMTARRMPYTGHDGFRGNLRHARGSVRGAVLDGARFYQAPDTQVDQGGAYGKRARGTSTPRHRPTLFTEPAPRTAQFYDTTASAGTTDVPGTHSQVTAQIHVSPQASRRGWRR